MKIQLDLSEMEARNLARFLNQSTWSLANVEKVADQIRSQLPKQQWAIGDCFADREELYEDEFCIVGFHNQHVFFLSGSKAGTMTLAELDEQYTKVDV